MFRHVLVPVDLGDGNRASLAMAAALTRCPAPGAAAPDEARLTLLHVIETIEHVPFDDLRDFYARLEEKARQGLAELAGEAPGPPPAQRIVFGKRAPAIVEFAAAEGCDLVVLGSRPVDPQRPGAWATISHQVALMAPCTVLLVR